MVQGKRFAVALIGIACGWIALAATGGAVGSIGAVADPDHRRPDRVPRRPTGEGGRRRDGRDDQAAALQPEPLASADRAQPRSSALHPTARDRTCTGTYILPKGTLVVTGTLQSRLLYEIPIVGGTGLFDNARGTLTVTASHLRPRHEVLVFRLVG